MSSQPGGATDFSARLQAALVSAKGKSVTAAAPPSTPTDSAPVDDEFNQRLNAAMGQARGESEPGAGETAPDAGGPVGSGDHIVRDGECVSSIAKKTGFFWETIWNEPGNAEVKEVRGDPNVLLPGDRLTVPELRRKDEQLAPEQRHRFKRKGEPVRFQLQLLEARDTVIDEENPRRQSTAAELPRGNVPYRLEIDNQVIDGQSDSSGYISCFIPGNASKGQLVLEPGTEREQVLALRLGTLSPVSTLCGVRERLANLAFELDDTESNETSEALEEALSAFQHAHGLPVTGKPDPGTRDMLRQAHGS